MSIEAFYIITLDNVILFDNRAYQKLWISPITVMAIEYSPVSVFPGTGHSPKEKPTLCSAKTSPSFAPYIHNTARTAISYPKVRITALIPTSLLSQPKRYISCKTDYYIRLWLG